MVPRDPEDLHLIGRVPKLGEHHVILREIHLIQFNSARGDVGEDPRNHTELLHEDLASELSAADSDSLIAGLIDKVLPVHGFGSGD